MAQLTDFIIIYGVAVDRDGLINFCMADEQERLVDFYWDNKNLTTERERRDWYQTWTDENWGEISDQYFLGMHDFITAWPRGSPYFTKRFALGVDLALFYNKDKFLEKNNIFTLDELLASDEITVKKPAVRRRLHKAGITEEPKMIIMPYTHYMG